MAIFIVSELTGNTKPSDNTSTSTQTPYSFEIRLEHQLSHINIPSPLHVIPALLLFKVITFTNWIVGAVEISSQTVKLSAEEFEIVATF
jgi:hypothetical protein